MKSPRPILIGVMLLSLACSSAQHVDPEEPSRLLGRESDVRIDAQLFGSARMSTSSVLSLNYEVQNFRQEPIAYAELVPQTEFDPDTRTINVTLGTEVPGNQLLPRLTVISPGEKKSFTTGVRFGFIIPNKGQFTAYPERLKIKFIYLRDVEPFRKLVGIQERAVNDPQMASDLFSAWLESQESVTTNAIPIQWSMRQENFGRRSPAFK